ncbi:MAG: hypothetical protein Q9180_006689, partial [Flavoplaca navasiana]
YLRVDVHDFSQYTFPLLPLESDVFQIAKEFLVLDGSKGPRLARVKEGESIMNKPLVSAYMQSLQEACKCAHCTGDLSTFTSCLEQNFKKSLVRIVTDILALSLFDTTEPIRVFLRPGPEVPKSNMFTNAVEGILFEPTGTYKSCDVLEPIYHALFLVGHSPEWPVSDDAWTWMASAAHGQVVYPAFFDNIAFDGRPLTRLAGGPGFLRHKNGCYDLVLNNPILHSPRFKRHDEPVNGPRNLAQQAKLIWKVQVANGYLQVAMLPSMGVEIGSPMSNFQNASKALYIPNCAHDKDAMIDPPDTQSFYTTGSYFKSPLAPDEKTPVVAVANDAELRFLALSGDDQGVIRGDCCLECCINICRLAGFNYVIS